MEMVYCIYCDLHGETGGCKTKRWCDTRCRMQLILLAHTLYRLENSSASFERYAWPCPRYSTLRTVLLFCLHQHSLAQCESACALTVPLQNRTQLILESDATIDL